MDPQEATQTYLNYNEGCSFSPVHSPGTHREPVDRGTHREPVVQGTHLEPVVQGTHREEAAAASPQEVLVVVDSHLDRTYLLCFRLLPCVLNLLIAKRVWLNRATPTPHLPLTKE